LGNYRANVTIGVKCLPGRQYYNRGTFAL